MENKNTYIVYIQRSEVEGIVSICSTTDLSKAKEIESHWKAICKVSLQTIPYPKSLESVDPPNVKVGGVKFSIGDKIEWLSSKTQKKEIGEIIELTNGKVIYVQSHDFDGSEALWDYDIKQREVKVIGKYETKVSKERKM